MTTTYHLKWQWIRPKKVSNRRLLLAFRQRMSLRGAATECGLAYPSARKRLLKMTDKAIGLLRSRPKVVCHRGHSMSDALIYLENGASRRRCKICHRESGKRSYERHRERHLMRGRVYRKTRRWSTEGPVLPTKQENQQTEQLNESNQVSKTV